MYNVYNTYNTYSVYNVYNTSNVYNAYNVYNTSNALLVNKGNILMNNDFLLNTTIEITGKCVICHFA